MSETRVSHRANLCAVFTGLWVVISLALLDVIASLIQEPTATTSLSAVGLGVVMSLLAYGTLYVASAVGIGFPLIVLAGLSPTGIALAAGVYAGVFGQLFVITEAGTFSPMAVHFRQAAMCAVAGLVAAVIVYVVAQRKQTGESGTGWLRIFGWALPALLAGALVIEATARYRREWFAASAIVVLVGGVALAGGFTMLLAAKAQRRKQLTRWSVVFAVMLGWTLWLVSSTESEVSAQTAGTTDEQQGKPNVILVSVDTLRANVLSCYGETRFSTPNFDHLAGDGIRFEEALSGAPWTLPGVASLLTGLPTTVHQTVQVASAVPDAIETLAERMRAAGYVTAGIGRNPWLSRYRNFDQGFAHYDFHPLPRMKSLGGLLVQPYVELRLMPGVSTTGLTNRTIAWLESNHQRPFFLWLHYLDPHTPYAPPTKYIAEDSKPTAAVRNSFNDPPGIRSGHFVPSVEDRARIEQLYLAEVRYVDDELGRLWQALDRLGLYDNTLIILTSDHGEEFWEHGGYEHGHTVHQEVIHVPLLVKPPHHNASEVVTRAVSTTSVYPTVLDVCGVQDSDILHLHGPSLLASMNMVPAAHAPASQPVARSPATESQPADDEWDLAGVVFSSGVRYGEDRLGVRFGHYKYIVWVISGIEELYDLSVDPDEQASIAATAPEVVKTGRELLAQHLQQSHRLREQLGIEAGQTVEGEDALTDRLRSLGYIQ